MSVLEPSAGKGDIAEGLKDAGADVTTIEINYTLQNILKEKGFEVSENDFLEHEKTYDRIVMNPPFENKQDIEHVKHAYKLLNPGGRVVAIVGGATGKRSGAVDQEFSDFVSTYGTIEDLPNGSFKSAFRTTGVSTQLVILDKPGETK